MLLKHSASLSAMQRAFVESMACGISPRDAAKYAGFSAPLNDSKSQLRNPVVAAAIAAESRRRLYCESGPAALVYLYKTMLDSMAPVKIRVECAKTIADRAGFIAPKASENNEIGGKPLNDMTADELREQVERIRKEMSDRAVVVLDSAPQLEAEGSEAFDITQ